MTIIKVGDPPGVVRDSKARTAIWAPTAMTRLRATERTSGARASPRCTYKGLDVRGGTTLVLAVLVVLVRHARTRPDSEPGIRSTSLVKTLYTYSQTLAR